jgi:hypothetical protein
VTPILSHPEKAYAMLAMEEDILCVMELERLVAHVEEQVNLYLSLMLKNNLVTCKKNLATLIIKYLIIKYFV